MFDLGGDAAAALANEARFLNPIMIGVFRLVPKVDRKKIR
jgi:hypothetical protein